MQRRIPERWRCEGWRQCVRVVVERWRLCRSFGALRRGLIGFRISSRLTGVELDFHVALVALQRAVSQQQRLYFLPEPQGHGSLRPALVGVWQGGG